MGPMSEEYGELWLGGWLVDGIEALGAALLIAPWCLLVLGSLVVWAGLPAVVAWVLGGLVCSGAVGWAFVDVVREDCVMRRIIRAGQQSR